MPCTVKCFLLDLPNSFFRELKSAAQLTQREGLPAVQSEPMLENLRFSMRKRTQKIVDIVTKRVLQKDLFRAGECSWPR